MDTIYERSSSNSSIPPLRPSLFEEKKGDDADKNDSSDQSSSSILESSTFAMAVSTLVYLYADLRLLSATGYASTPFEQLMVDSDAYYGRIPPIGGLDESEHKRRCQRRQSPGNMLLALLQELQREAASFRDSEALEAQLENLQSRYNRRRESKLEAQDRRQRLRERAAPMVFLTSDGNNDFLGRRRTTSILNPNTNPSSSSKEDEGDDTQANNALLDCAELILKSSLKTDLIEQYDDNNNNNNNNKKQQPMEEEEEETASASLLKTNFKLKYSHILLQSLYRDAIKAGLCDPDRPSMHRMHSGYFNCNAGGNDDMNNELQQNNSRHQRYLRHQHHHCCGEGEPEDGALLLLEEAVNAPPDDPIFNVLAQQFKPNSIADRLLSDKTELVWFHDYFPSHEAVFGILVSHERRAIQVVFRGTVTIENWISNLDFFGVEVPNPIKEYYPDKEEYFKLHKGFQMYVLRERKDTNQAWWKTICDLVDHFGRIHFDGNYQLTISGHSLGGACGTIFGFYASTDPRMTQQGRPVVVESFASPMVGCHYFADAFRHQERMGKLRHSRFYNQYDIVPRLPLNIKLWEERGSPWAHTGIGIELRRPIKDSWSIRGLCDRLYHWCIPRRDGDYGGGDCRLVKVKYATAKSYWPAMMEALKNNLLLHVDIFNVGRNHVITEHEERLERALMATSEISNQSLTKVTMEDLYGQYLQLDENQLYFDGDIEQMVALQLCQDTTSSAVGTNCREILDGTN